MKSIHLIAAACFAATPVLAQASGSIDLIVAGKTTTLSVSDLRALP